MSHHWIKTKPPEVLPFTLLSPQIRCDCCGKVYAVLRGRYFPRWYKKGSPPPKWSGGVTDDGTRLDYCPQCTLANEVRP